VVIRLAFLIWGAALGGFCRDFNRRAWTFWDGMRREIERRAALRFYADEANWKLHVTPSGWSSAAAADDGERARAALRRQ
jgi:hypothetical protein